MSKEKFDRNAPHINLKEVGQNREITPGHAETITAGFKKLCGKPGTVPEDELYDGLGGPEEREPGFELPKPKHR